jgi:hypothetical protein
MGWSAAGNLPEWQFELMVNCVSRCCARTYDDLGDEKKLQDDQQRADLVSLVSGETLCS